MSGNFCKDDDRKISVLQSEIASRWTPKRELTDLLVSIYDHLTADQDIDISAARVHRLDNCGSYLEFGFSPELLKWKLKSANFCRDRLCPMCQWRKSLKMFSQVSSVMNWLSASASYKSCRYAFLTLTLKSCSDAELKDNINVLLSGFGELTHHSKIFRKKVVAGTFRALEITRNKKTGLWHPHLHVILALTSNYFKHGLGFYMTHDQWSELWGKCIDADYNPVIDIRMIKSYKPENCISTEELYSKAIAEVTKYAVKGSDFIDPLDLNKTTENVKTLLKSITGKRLYSFTGCFFEARKALKLDDIEEGDLVNTDPDQDQVNIELANMIIKYQWKGGVYQQV